MRALLLLILLCSFSACQLSPAELQSRVDAMKPVAEVVDALIGTVHPQLGKIEQGLDGVKIGLDEVRRRREEQGQDPAAPMAISDYLQTIGTGLLALFVGKHVMGQKQKPEGSTPA